MIFNSKVFMKKKQLSYHFNHMDNGRDHLMVHHNFSYVQTLKQNLLEMLFH
jgi:hypothetical protein